MSSIAKLKALLELDDDGEEIAEIIAGALIDGRKRDLFLTRLDEIRSQLQGMDAKLELTDGEDAVMRFVVDAKRPLTTTEVAESIGQRFPSLK